MFFSALTGALITFLTALLALYTDLDTGASFTDIGSAPIAAAAIGALLSALNKIQALLAAPPT